MSAARIPVTPPRLPGRLDAIVTLRRRSAQARLADAVRVAAARPERPAWVPHPRPGPPRQTLMTVTFRPHRVAMSSGSDVRTVTGPGAAKAVALSMASIA